MATNRLPVPLGTGTVLPAMHDGTLCRAPSPAPGPTGLMAGHSLSRGTAQELVEQPAGKRDSDVDVDKYLQGLGKTGAPPLVRQRVAQSAEYFESHFATKTTEEIVGFLKGIDFSLDVRMLPLAAIAPVGSILIQNVTGGRAGNFFTKPGYAAERLGIASGNRTYQRFRVFSGSAMVLVSTAASVSDTWTPGRTLNVYTPTAGRQPGQPPGRAGELVGGGGLQIIIPDPLKNSLTPLDAPS